VKNTNNCTHTLICMYLTILGLSLGWTSTGAVLLASLWLCVVGGNIVVSLFEKKHILFSLKKFD